MTPPEREESARQRQLAAAASAANSIRRMHGTYAAARRPYLTACRRYAGLIRSPTKRRRDAFNVAVLAIGAGAVDMMTIANAMRVLSVEAQRRKTHAKRIRRVQRLPGTA